MGFLISTLEERLGLFSNFFLAAFLLFFPLLTTDLDLLADTGPTGGFLFFLKLTDFCSKLFASGISEN